MRTRERTKMLRIRVTPREHQDLKKLATETGETMSNLVREAFKQALVGIFRRKRTIAAELGHHYGR
jgi:predicted DNA-binding protein